jgi:hypothetical protein
MDRKCDVHYDIISTNGAMQALVPWPHLPVDTNNPWVPFQAGGIRFGGFAFSEPAPAGTARVPHAAGLYVVLEPAPVWRPRPYRPVSFGSAGNLNEALQRLSEHYSGPFLVAVCPLLFATPSERASAQKYLASLYGCAEEPAATAPSLEARLRRLEEQVLPREEDRAVTPVAKRPRSIGFIRAEA